MRTPDRNARAVRDEAAIVVGHRTPLTAEEWSTVRDLLTSGHERYVAAVVLDDDGRTAFVQNRWSDGWVLPGGGVEGDESLTAAAEREVREETGLSVTVDRPVACVEQTFVHDGEHATGFLVVFATRAETSTFGADLGVDDQEISEARWFDELPVRIDGVPRDLLSQILLEAP